MQRSIIAPAERVTNLRWGIALLLGIGALIASLDRVIVLDSSLRLVEELRIGTMALGQIMVACGLLFFIAQIPLGALIDRFGVTLFGRVATFCWSIVALFSGAFGTYFEGLGPADSTAYMIGAKATGYWFPANERGFATAIFDAAAKVAVAIGLPLAPWLLAAYGWRTTLIGAAIVSFIFFAAFYVFYRDPAEHPGLTHAERQHIANGGAQQEGRPARGTFVYLLRQPKVWGLTLGFAAYAYSCALLLIVPGYLQRTFNMTPASSGIYAAIPWLVGAVAELLVGGLLVDALIKHAADATRVRQTVLVIGMLFGLCVFGCAATRDPNVAIACIALAFAGLAIAAPVIWSLPSLIAPRGAVGLVFAIMNFAGILAAVASPIVGDIVAETSYTNLVLSAAVILIAGLASYLFLLGRIEPLPEAE